MTPAEMQEQLDIDAAGFVAVAAPALPHLRETEGSIVAVTTAELEARAAEQARALRSRARPEAHRRGHRSRTNAGHYTACRCAHARANGSHPALPAPAPAPAPLPFRLTSMFSAPLRPLLAPADLRVCAGQVVKEAGERPRRMGQGSGTRRFACK